MVEIASWVALFCRIHAKNDQNDFNFVIVVYRKLLVANNFITRMLPSSLVEIRYSMPNQVDFEF